MSEIMDGIKQISADELKELLEKESAIKFIDVREWHEYVAGHIPGVPLIPMQQIPAHMEKLPKEDTYVFICRSGNRSHLVSKFLQQNGYERVINFNGGMLSWRGPVKQGMEP
jgi:rhodanese-related sulfurtransferase